MDQHHSLTEVHPSVRLSIHLSIHSLWGLTEIPLFTLQIVYLKSAKVNSYHVKSLRIFALATIVIMQHISGFWAQDLIWLGVRKMVNLKCFSLVFYIEIKVYEIKPSTMSQNWYYWLCFVNLTFTSSPLFGILFLRYSLAFLRMYHSGCISISIFSRHGHIHKRKHKTRNIW